jgi:rRNA-processing protein FCF1
MTPLPTRVLVDANFLILWKGRGAHSDTKARIDHFVDRLDKSRSRLVIPTPAIAEYLVGADLAGVAAMNALHGKSGVVIAAFDYKAAVELSLLDRAALGGATKTGGDKRDGVDAPWQKIKIDRQIVAIARSNGCDLIVSEDQGVRANALRLAITACAIGDLELPDSARQHPLDFEKGRPTKASTLRSEAKS